MPNDKLNLAKIRKYVRILGNETHFYLLEDALSLLSQDQLRQLFAPYIHLAQLVGQENPEDLLSEVKAFQKASLAGKYYEDPSDDERHHGRNPRETFFWIADFRL